MPFLHYPTTPASIASGEEISAIEGSSEPLAANGLVVYVGGFLLMKSAV